jgi:hypothetical protein
VAAAVGEHLLAALLAEGIEALAAQLQQLFALGVDQLYCCAEAFGYAAHQVVGASLVAGDAVAREHLAHHALDALCVVVDLGHLFPQDPAGHVLRRGRAGCCLANQCPRSSMSIRGC